MSRRLTVNDQYSSCDWPVNIDFCPSVWQLTNVEKEKIVGEKNREKYSGYDKQGKYNVINKLINVRSMIDTTITELPYEVKSEIFSRIPVQG